MMKVNKINWLSIDAKEAEVYLSDGNFNLICFSQPFYKEVGDDVEFPLYALNVNLIYKSEHDSMDAIHRVNDGFEYCLNGKIISVENNQIQVGNFIIQLDVPLPQEYKNNDYIMFNCDRIDIW